MTRPYTAQTLPFLLLALLSGCLHHPVDLSARMPTRILAARHPAASPLLVIVLPGRGDELEDLADSGIGAAIQDALPEAEVEFVGATMPYYRAGFVERLDSEIVAPARARGFREIWMVGISLGGMGTILYEHNYPGELTGLVLLSPYVGEPALVSEVIEGGGPIAWRPAPGIQPDGVAIPTLEWQTIQRWASAPNEAMRVWFSCGTTDRFRPAADLIGPILVADHVFEPGGGHNWGVWLPASRDIFRRIAVSRGTSPALSN